MIHFHSALHAAVFLAFACSVSSDVTDDENPINYGVDVSFPVHHHFSSSDRGSHFSKQYGEFITGCYRKWSSKMECDACENARLEMSMEQPATEHNYTAMGFKKTKVPEHLWKSILEFYTENKAKEEMEMWPRGNTYVNYWDAPTYMIRFEDTNLRGGEDLKQQIWDEVRPVIEEWVGRPVYETSLYGIRVYKEGAVLSPHVDRLPLVSSAIINVAQDVTEPWPLEVYSHDGKAYNVTMEPGDMVLYESHTVIHGRPFAMKGKFFANIFVHYKPYDHEENNEQDRVKAKEKEEQEKGNVVQPGWSLKRAFDGVVKGLTSKVASASRPKAAVSKVIAGHEQSNHDPGTMERLQSDMEDIEDEVEKAEAGNDTKAGTGTGAEAKDSDKQEGHYSNSALLRKEKKKTGKVQRVSAKEGLRTPGQTALHIAAGKGDLHAVEMLLSKGEDKGEGKGEGKGRTPLDIHAKDSNDWQAVHEGALKGHLEVLKYLVKMGADLGTKTIQGGTPLWWARRTLPEGHAVVAYLQSIGAPDEGDDL